MASTQEWQSISSAPKDGTEILISSEDWHGDVVLSGWHFGAWRERADPEAETREPTIWVPLQSVPSSHAEVGPRGNANVLARLSAEISALKLHPATSEDYDAGYIAARNDAAAILQEASDNGAVATSELLDALRDMIAFSIEPDPDTTSFREQQLCKAWAKSRAAIENALSSN